jgi:guanylate kinase
MVTEKNGMMFILSSPSGAGKTTLTKKLTESNKNFSLSISHTTRSPRPNEINGKDYHFVSQQEFEKLIKKNNFYEYANIFNNNYGTLKKSVLELLSKGKDVLFDIDWQGTKQLKKVKNLSIKTFFILPPNLNTLRKRLLNRHEGQESLVEERMKKFKEELSHWNEYDYIIVNDDLETCYNDILKKMIDIKKGKEVYQDLNDIKKKIEILFK